MRWPRFLAAPRVRQAVQSAALASLMAAITVLSVKVFGWRWPRSRNMATVAAHRPARFDLSHDQRLIAVPPEADSRELEPSRAASSDAPKRLSAAEMFAAATRARSAGNVRLGLRYAKQIEEFFPNSAQGIDAHLLLGLLYLEGDQAELALQEFATFRRVGPPEAKAEALFGQAQALRKLSRFEDERTVLGELLQSYPGSAYVAAARIRLRELEADVAPP